MKYTNFGIAIADKIWIKGETYSLENTTVIIGIIDTGKGKQSEKYERLERHLKRYFSTNPSKSVNKVRIVSCEEFDMVRKIERLIRLELGKNT